VAITVAQLTTFLKILIYERLTIPVLPRQKVSIRIVSGAVYEFDFGYLWIGLDERQRVNIQIGFDWVSKSEKPTALNKSDKMKTR